MADDDEPVAWDAGTDAFITNIDKQIVKTYGMSLRELLMNPEKFSAQKDVLQKVDKIKNDVDGYFGKLKDGMKEEEEELTKNLETADALTTKIDESIATKAALGRVPYVKPYFIDFDSTTKEEITVDQYNNSVDALVAKLVSVSTYVGDMTGEYGKYMIGSWVFSGHRTYVLSVNLPENAIMVLDKLNTTITDLIEEAYQKIKLSA